MKEESNEMRKVRNVQGELTDLPEFNPRATLASRIRALLLEATGLPSLAHDYGTLGRNEELVTTSYGGAVTQIVSDGTFLYYGTEDIPGKIVKIDLDDFSYVNSVTLGSALGRSECLTLDDTYLYVGDHYDPATITRIRLSDFTIFDTLTLNVGDDYATELYVNGKYLIVTTTANIVRVDLDTFTRVDALVNTGAGGSTACSDGIFLYVVGGGIIDKIDLESFTEVDTIDTGYTTGFGATTDGISLYVCYKLEVPGKIVKLGCKNLDIKKVLTLDAGENTPKAVLLGNTYLYVGLGISPGELVIVDPVTFTRINKHTFANNESEALFTDGTYIYTGLHNALARNYIYPTKATIDYQWLEKLHRQLIEQSMPLAFYGKITTYTDPTHFKISTLSGDFGDDFFKNWYVYVVRDSAGAGAAPQGEDVKKITDYVSSTGAFTHLSFTANLAVDDEVLILHESIALAGAGSDYSGDIEIWDSFEYPSNAALQANWIEGGSAGNPTRSATSYYGQYGMESIVAGGTGYVYRTLTARNMKTLSNISIAARSNKAAGDTFRFTLYDSSGNYSYWTQTIAAQNTWENFNINPHSSPTAASTPAVDLEDIVEIRLANLTDASTYTFDLIRFESLVASKIGVGYDGQDDAVEETSSVRGHLLLIRDNLGTQKAYFKRRIVMGDTGAAQELTADPTTFEDSDAHVQAVINTWEDSALEYTIDGPETEVKTVQSLYIDLTWKDQLTGATATAGKSKWQINRGNAAPGTWDDLTDDHAAAAGEATVHRSGATMNETNGLQLPFKIKLQVQADKAEANAITVKAGSECIIEVEYEI